MTNREERIQPVGLEAAKLEAERCLAESLPQRWAHVQTVGRVAETLLSEMPRLGPSLAIAAWLHDIGYAPALVTSGFHPLDGARHLAEEGWPEDVVRLVAHHTGARFEAEERGLLSELDHFPEPEALTLDALCLADLTTGPDGRRVTVEQRIEEILSRYAEGDPVHRAITRAGPYLRAAASHAAADIGSADEWCRAAVQGVLDS